MEADISRKFNLLRGTLTERQRRLWAAAETLALGHGGTGVKLTKNEMCRYEKRLVRTPNIDRWSLKIKPHKKV